MYKGVIKGKKNEGTITWIKKMGWERKKGRGQKIGADG